VRNLLSNAIRASPKGGVVRIGATVEMEGSAGGARARIIVADEGEGMSDEIRRATLFRRPLDSPGREGLGLAICREVASFHGGDFAIDNGGECGMVVRISLPMWRGWPAESGRSTR
jgi:signal transduction histidine kinase